MRAIDPKPRKQYFFIKVFTTFSLCHEKIYRCSRCIFAIERRIVSRIDRQSFINEKGQIDKRKKIKTTSMQTTIAMIDDKKNSFDLSSEEVCNDFALSGFVLFYFVSEGAAFVHSCRSSSGSDYQPRWGASSREMRVPIAPNRRRNGIGSNDERCNTGFVLSHVLSPFHPFPPPSTARSPHLSFSWFNIRSGWPPSSLFGAEQFRTRIGFSCRRIVKRDASKRFFNLSSFRVKIFLVRTREIFCTCAT